MWGLGLFVMGLFGIVLINLFGNITVTNQLNYTTMKNAVEASMNDALDIAHYRTGFCICSDKIKDSTSKVAFNDDTEYQLYDISYDKKTGEAKCPIANKCRILYGEYRINPKIFSESLTRRIAEMVNNNKAYNVVIQDIIEYPPKVSVMVNSDDQRFSPTEVEADGHAYTITNQIDAIIESNGRVAIPKVIPTPVPTPKPTPTPTRPTSSPRVVIQNDEPGYVYTSTPDPTPAVVITAKPVTETTPEPTVEATSEPTVEATPEPTVEATPDPTPAGCSSYTWTSSYYKASSCPSERAPSNPSKGDSYSYLYAEHCKLCFNCGSASVSNSSNANCISVGSCPATAACPSGSSVVSSSCTCTKECVTKTYVCND